LPHLIKFTIIAVRVRIVIVLLKELVMKITSKGQVTIPQDIREKAGLLPGTEVVFVMKGKSVSIRRSPSRKRRGKRLIEALAGSGNVRMTTDQIMALTCGEDNTDNG
jgi:AbrB family looped-hinge helix DNA binding protein